MNKAQREQFFRELGFKLTGEPEALPVILHADRAKTILSFSIGNRNINEAEVKNHVDSIRTGKFFLVGDIIGLDNDYILRNGHHRLTAIARSGGSAQVWVSVNSPLPGFEHTDRGRKRDMASQLCMFSSAELGFNPSKTDAAIANLLYRNVVNSAGTSSINVLKPWLSSYSEQFKLLHSEIMCHTNSMQKNLGNAGVKAALVLGYDNLPRELVTQFGLELYRSSTPEGTNGNAAKLLRHYCEFGRIRESLMKLGIVNSSHYSSRVYLQATLYALQKYAKGVNVQSLNLGVKKVELKDEFGEVCGVKLEWKDLPIKVKSVDY